MYNGTTNQQVKLSATSSVPVEYTGLKPTQLSFPCTIQKFLLIWLDGSIDQVNNRDAVHTISKLKKVINKIITFTDVKKCINFIDNIKDEKTVMISSGALGQIAIPMIHNKPQISSIYIFCANRALHETWARNWSKIKGVFTGIRPICKALKQAIDECDQSLISISIVINDHEAIKKNPDQSNASFISTQMMKEIILNIHYEKHYFGDFITYCRQVFAKNPIELRNVDKFEREYQQSLAIWWYTHPGFLSSMLNRALRLMEVDLVMRIGFFIQDLHNHIAALHTKQYTGQAYMRSFTVYRGQRLSQTDFDQLIKAQGGFLSFNHFLLTSKNYLTSLNGISDTIQTQNRVDILFAMIIDPSITSIPFANISDVSYFREEEILFSMNSIFRIDQIKRMNNNQLWQVDLTLMNNNEPELYDLTEQMRKETYADLKGWDRLGMLLVKFGQFNKAQEVYDMLIDQTKSDSEKADVYHMLGWVKDGQGEYTNALAYYKQSINIKQKILSPDSVDLAVSYQNIGVVYEKMAAYSTALSFHQQALEIRKKILPSKHLDLANSYDHIGLIYGQIGDYRNAILFHRKALEIYEKKLPSNHPDLAISYNHIGLVYGQMGDYSNAFSSHRKALEIYQETLPIYHPHLATSYNNIGLVYSKMGDYSNSLLAHEKALEIRKNILPPNHPDLATSYNNIGMLYAKKGELSKALLLYERALEIGQHSLPQNHQDILLYKHNIQLIKNKL